MMHSEAESKLLTEGAETYVGAVNAIRAFREIIQRRCRQVVENRLPEYGKALDWKLSPDAIMDYETTDGEWNGEEVTIGTYIKFGPVSALYHLVYLTADGTPPAVGMTVYLGSQKKRDRFWATLHPHEPALEKVGNRSIWLSTNLKPEELGQFDEVLDVELKRWINLWERAGGLKPLLKQTADVEE